MSTEPSALPAEAAREAVLALYDRGLFVQAHRLALGSGPYESWRGTSARILAGRLHNQLGAPGRSEGLLLRAWRDDPSDPEARYFRAVHVLNVRGPLFALRHLEAEGPLPETAPADLRGSWSVLRAECFGRLRDFEQARRWLDEALQVAPGSRWVHCHQADLLLYQDRHAEALEVARAALREWPWYVPAVVTVAQCLVNLDRLEEAAELLAEADAHVESGRVAAFLAGLLEDLGRHDESERALARFEALSPLLERAGRRWLAGHRADLACHRGQFALAARLARASGDRFFRVIAERLEKLKGDERRVLLPVGFVLQHHQTCAPSTLAVLSGFWGRPVDHLEVAAEITFDGTPSHAQRDWAERQGFVVREFSLGWEPAVALLDRGVPFTLATRSAVGGHMQAVIGYDARRKTLLVRDPSLRRLQEYEADAFLERNRASGPRAMVMVPPDKAALLEGIELPEAALYDLEHQLQRALFAADRELAGRLCDQLWAAAPGQRLALEARVDLSFFDCDAAARLEHLDALVALFPDEARFASLRIGCLHELSRAEERGRALRELACGRLASPVFWHQYAEELRGDARLGREAQRLLIKALSCAPGEAMAYHILADLRWGERAFDEALSLYRFAACLDDKHEHLARAYFDAAHSRRRTGEGLAFLVDRARRFARQSGAAARTLFAALDDLQRTDEAFAELDRALEARPEDGELLLFAANEHARLGRFERAAALLERAEGRSRREQWLRASAWMANLRGDCDRALECWREVAAREPSAIDAHLALADALAAQKGGEEGLAFLKEWAERFPHHYGIWQSVAGWSRSAGAAEAEAVLLRLQQIAPRCAWTCRELATNLLYRKQVARAEEAVRAALELDPNSAFGWALRARVCAEQGKPDEAAQHFRRALRLCIDLEVAIAGLLAVSDGPQARREALRFVHSELLRQVSGGDGIGEFHRQALGLFAPDELLAALEALREEHPGLWHAAIAVVRQLSELGRHDEALAAAKQAAERFPSLPRAWVELAAVHQARGEEQPELEALERALAISPGWSEALRLVSAWHERHGELERALEPLELAVSRDGGLAVNHGCLADILWRLGRREEALEAIGRAVRLDLGYEWAWDSLFDWSRQAGKPQLAAEAAREICQRRGDEARAWLVLARTVEGEERLAALDKAVAIYPRSIDAHEQRALALDALGRHDEARRACRPEVFGEQPPPELRSCEALLLQEQGDPDGALKLFEQLVADDPDFYLGWQRLADAACARGKHLRYLEAARQLVRVAPRGSIAWGYLAHACLENGDRAQAKKALQHALDLDPNNLFAARKDFDLALEDGELERAGADLRLLEGRLPASERLARGVALLGKSGQAEALVSFNALIRREDAEPDDLRWALDSLAPTAFGAMAEEALESAVEAPGTPAAAGAVLAQRLLKQGGAERAITWSRNLGEKTAASTAALCELVTSLAESRSAEATDLLLRMRGEWLRADPLGWGRVGYAFFRLGRFAEAAEWMRDWKSREGVLPWMVSNLVAALHAQGRHGEAFEVAREGLTLPPDGETEKLRAMVALAAAERGEVEQAGARLAEVCLDKASGNGRFVAALAQAVLAAARVPLEAGAERLAEARERLTGLRRAEPAVLDCADDRQLYALAVRAVSRGRPWPVRLWALGERLAVLARRVSLALWQPR